MFGRKGIDALISKLKVRIKMEWSAKRVLKDVCGIVERMRHHVIAL